MGTVIAVYPKVIRIASAAAKAREPPADRPRDYYHGIRFSDTSPTSARKGDCNPGWNDRLAFRATAPDYRRGGAELRSGDGQRCDTASPRRCIVRSARISRWTIAIRALAWNGKRRYGRSWKRWAQRAGSDRAALSRALAINVVGVPQDPVAARLDGDHAAAGDGAGRNRLSSLRTFRRFGAAAAKLSMAGERVPLADEMPATKFIGSGWKRI